MTVREEAEFVRLALAMGLIDKQQVVAWADRTIETQQALPNELIDISLGARLRPHAILSLLGRMPGDGDLTRVAHGVLGLLRSRFLQGSIPLAEVGEMLSAYRVWASVPEKEALWAGNCAYLCEECIEDIARGDIEQFLDKFSAPPAEDAPF